MPRLRRRTGLVAILLALAASVGGSGTAYAAIQPTSDADELAEAIVADPTTLAPSAQLTGTPLADGVLPNAVSDVALGGFPTQGSTYAILTTGNPEFADDPNDTPSTGADTWSGEDSASLRGDTDFDVSVLEVKVNVPATANCLVLRYRFLSDEFPEFVGTAYNDAFIAEVDQSTWTTSATTITAPNDFATKTAGEGVNVNGVGPVAVTPEESADTTYDAATGLVTSKTAITSGPHSVFLSIFDQGDHAYDSAAFVDSLAFITEDPSTCKPPEVPVILPPPPGPPAPPQPTNDFTVPGGAVVFKSGSTVVTVVVPGPGTVTAGQAGGSAARAGAAARRRRILVKRVRKVATKAGPVRLTIKPTRAGRKVLRRKKKLTVRLRITYTPTGGTAKSMIKRVTIKRRVR